MRRLPIRPVLPLLGAALLTGCGTSPEQHFARAQQRFAAEDYRGTRAELNQALRKHPGNRAWLLLLAQTDLRLGDGDAAQNDAARLRAAGLDPARLAPIEAEAALDRGQFDAALAAVSNGSGPDVWRIRAAAYLAQGNTAAAQAAFASGLAEGDDPRLLADHIRFLLANGDLAGAGAGLARLRRERPDGLATLMLSGALAERQGGQGAALDAYRRAHELYPARSDPLLAEANVLDLQGKTDAAIALAKDADAIDPGNRAVRDLRLSLYSEKGDWEKVRSLLQHDESELDPNSADGMTYAEALLRLGHPEQARALFSQAVLNDPANRYARMMLGEAQLATQDPVAAYATLKPLVVSVFVNPRELELTSSAASAAQSPDAPGLAARLHSPAFRQQVALVNQGQAASARGDDGAALAAYQQLAAFGRDPELLRRMAYAASRLGRHTEALGWADDLLAASPGDAEVQHLAGLVRLDAGADGAKALSLLRAAAEAQPGNAAFKSDLARAQARFR